MKKKRGEKRPHKQILNLSPNVSVRHCVTRYDIPWSWDSIENLCAAANCSPSKQTRAQSNSPSGISRFDLVKQVSSQNFSPQPSFNSSSIIVQLNTFHVTSPFVQNLNSEIYLSKLLRDRETARSRTACSANIIPLSCPIIDLPGNSKCCRNQIFLQDISGQCCPKKGWLWFWLVKIENRWLS